ncbi:hypothetical protein AB6A40_004651 [Gnathostoma spinigerum]|uniref:SSD domain-containing protein n=1 Tax=Gnathostoma spinigerum TaxID=75299 RepID=A0ABD6EMK5_9BILA
MFTSRVLRTYCDLLFRYPGITVLITVLLSTVAPCAVIYFNTLRISQNPEVGFDTRGTELSGPRLAWQSLTATIRRSNRVALQSDGDRRRWKRSWADDLLLAFGQVACYESPIVAMDFLTQFVIEVPSYDSMFRYDFLKNLCDLHFYLKDVLKEFDSITPYRNILGLPNYLTCLSPNYLANCSFLTQKDIEIVRNIVDYCRRYRKPIVECRSTCHTAKCAQCPDVPSNCSSQMIFDLFYRILPVDLDGRPMFLNNFLPIFTFSGYHSRGFFNTTVAQYLQLQNKLRLYAKRSGFYELKGLSMDIKRNILYDGARRDSLLACGAAACVFLLIFLYSFNPFLCIGVFFMLGASALCALAVYSCFTDEVPLLNLIVFVLLLAIGSDDAFLLYNSFPSSITPPTIEECLAHTAGAMLLTSSSTAVPFFTNILSSVVVFRCFGLFAGLTLFFNYLLEISFLPALLILQRRYCDYCTSVSYRPFSWLSYLMRDILPPVIVAGRYIWICSLSLTVISATYLSVIGLRFPEYNPLQLFVSSNEHEWFDNNAERTFDFIKNKLEVSINVRLVWGLSTVDQKGVFQLQKFTAIRRDPNFRLSTTSHVGQIANALRAYRYLDFVDHAAEYWPERYLKWSEHFQCVIGKTCCNHNDPTYNQSNTDYCIRLSTTDLYTQYNDTPIYDNTSFELVGYTALLPTKFNYSHRFANLSHSFGRLKTSFGDMKGGWYTTEWPLLGVWFDLLQSILADCRQSVLLSFTVVAVFALLHLKLIAPVAILTIISIVIVSVACVIALGWVIGVLEAVILVLVVGLSFDFTLHYGASVPSTGCAAHRVQLAAEKSSVPVGLAALSSIIAGGMMLFAETHAFFQVGVFLVTSTTISWLFSTFFFLPLLTFVLRGTKSCDCCNILSRTEFSLREKVASR